MSYIEEFSNSLKKLNSDALPEWFSADCKIRLENLAEISPVYSQLILNNPDYLEWLENPEIRDTVFKAIEYEKEWCIDYSTQSRTQKVLVKQLREFRRKMSLRVAYREINNLVKITDTFKELTSLAEFCLQRLTDFTIQSWSNRLGLPWNEETESEARFCILGLGKFGGNELNFYSDLDLIYFYDGNGYCKKNGRLTHTSLQEFYSRVCRDITAKINEKVNYGSLYNVDLRLRPEGDTGPIARSFSSMEAYYFETGQIWERMALIKARPVAGDINLGHELLENLNNFRYPRFLPETILPEVAGVKLRIEKEVVGKENLELDIKNGEGGIREIEFFVQALQLINAGRNPFLQTGSTLKALEKLSRYKLITKKDQKILTDYYLFLRLVENRLQMRDERQTHKLPTSFDRMKILAKSLNFTDVNEFEAHINDIRKKVRKNYNALFSEVTNEEYIQEWSLFISKQNISDNISNKLKSWFQSDNKDVIDCLIKFILGAPHNLLTREHITLFLDISKQFDTALKPLANSLLTLKRITHFADKYGARKQFLKMCNQNPQFFKSLVLLFDRSKFIFDLLSNHPEIMEEIFYSGLRVAKGNDVITDELSHIPASTDNELAKWLWLYVKAEQVRLAIGELLNAFDYISLEEKLTQLADLTINHVLKYLNLETDLAIVGFGKYGGSELIFGSDLDIMIFCSAEVDSNNINSCIKRLLKILNFHQTMGQTFDVDLRLRPHGNDGPIITTLNAFQIYHSNSALTWEKQILTRSRFVAGNKILYQEFNLIKNNLIYSKTISKDALIEIDEMREKILAEKVTNNSQYLDFKSGKGGIHEIEFLCQKFQLLYGYHNEQLRITETRKILIELIASNLINEQDGTILIKNYNILRKVECYLRRNTNSSVTNISNNMDEIKTISIWLGYENSIDFEEQLKTIMLQNITIIKNIKI